MSDWSPHELETIGDATEIDIATVRRDGTLRSCVPIWIVRVADQLLVRSYRGDAGSWYRYALKKPQGRVRVVVVPTGIEPVTFRV